MNIQMDQVVLINEKTVFTLALEHDYFIVILLFWVEFYYLNCSLNKCTKLLEVYSEIKQFTIYFTCELSIS